MYTANQLQVIETQLQKAGITEDECYFCSLSSKTVVYKGQLTPQQVGCAPAPVPHCAWCAMTAMAALGAALFCVHMTALPAEGTHACSAVVASSASRLPYAIGLASSCFAAAAAV